MNIFVIIVSSFLYGIIITFLKTALGISLGGIPTVLLCLVLSAITEALYKVWKTHKSKKNKPNNEEEQPEKEHFVEETKLDEHTNCQHTNQTDVEKNLQLKTKSRLINLAFLFVEYAGQN